MTKVALWAPRDMIHPNHHLLDDTGDFGFFFYGDTWLIKKEKVKDTALTMLATRRRVFLLFSCFS